MTATNLISCSKHLHPCQTKERSKDLTDPLGLGPAANRAWCWWIIITNILICMKIFSFSRCDRVAQVLGQNVPKLLAVLSQKKKSGKVWFGVLEPGWLSLCAWVVLLRWVFMSICVSWDVDWSRISERDVWRRHGAQWDRHWNPGTKSNVAKSDWNPPWAIVLFPTPAHLSRHDTQISIYYKVTDRYMYHTMTLLHTKDTYTTRSQKARIQKTTNYTDTTGSNTLPHTVTPIETPMVSNHALSSPHLIKSGSDLVKLH